MKKMQKITKIQNEKVSNRLSTKRKKMKRSLRSSTMFFII